MTESSLDGGDFKTYLENWENQLPRLKNLLLMPVYNFLILHRLSDLDVTRCRGRSKTGFIQMEKEMASWPS